MLLFAPALGYYSHITPNFGFICPQLLLRSVRPIQQLRIRYTDLGVALTSAIPCRYVDKRAYKVSFCVDIGQWNHGARLHICIAITRTVQDRIAQKAAVGATTSSADRVGACKEDNKSRHHEEAIGHKHAPISYQLPSRTKSKQIQISHAEDQRKITCNKLIVVTHERYFKIVQEKCQSGQV